uniref:Nuclear factor of activated T cells 2 n=1 Tax=Suricata suricatta TaxID=37032 RepID=A0A673UEA4_SURSU
MENKPLGLQIFIGTADERILKPHAFYQVHRITGKTVTTTSYEKIVGNTKVLEIPLEPKNNMRATIDCAGILKLRNADIELRKGETDIGRKNTRVRLVFRVHIPESSGRIVSLQTASNPIECSQRSAHELPMVERQDIDSCLVYGGQQMILTGQNFTAESKVVFTEKTTGQAASPALWLCDRLTVSSFQTALLRGRGQVNRCRVSITPPGLSSAHQRELLTLFSY